MGIKERRTKILLALFLLSEQPSVKSQNKFSSVPFDDKLQLVFDLTLNQKTRGTISALIKEGSIQKDGENVILGSGAAPGSHGDSGQARMTYHLTDKGFQSLCFEFPFFRFLIEKWDGKWRVISYEIPESKREIRDRLRREMQGWGLGPWHRSFWLTPHPVTARLSELVSQKEEEQYIQAFEADHAFGKREILIEKVWATSVLDKKYRELFKKWHEILSKDGEKPEKLKKVIGDYVGILREDPGLPSDLIGEKWIGFEAINIFREIKSILLA